MQPRLRDAARSDGLCHRGDHGGEAILLNRRLDKIVARQKRPHTGLGDPLRGIGVALLLHKLDQPLRVHRIGDDDPLIAELSAQHLLHQHWRERGGSCAS